MLNDYFRQQIFNFSGEILEPGDAIVEVNGKSVVGFTHDQVVQKLRSCGPIVHLTVKTFEHAHQILHGYS